MPSLRDSTVFTLLTPGTSVPGYYYAVPPGLVAVLPLNCVMEGPLSSARATYDIWPMAKSKFGRDWLGYSQPTLRDCALIPN
jgi:hypothetical protein